MGDSVAKLGVNATATAPNLLTVRSSAALFHAIVAADGGSGDMRLQIANKANVWLSQMEVAGRKVTGFDGRPVRRTDAISLNESQVSA